MPWFGSLLLTRDRVRDKAKYKAGGKNSWTLFIWCQNRVEQCTQIRNFCCCCQKGMRGGKEEGWSCSTWNWLKVFCSSVFVKDIRYIRTHYNGNQIVGSKCPMFIVYAYERYHHNISSYNGSHSAVNSLQWTQLYCPPKPLLQIR